MQKLPRMQMSMLPGLLLFLCLCLSLSSVAQTATPTTTPEPTAVFATTTVTMNLTPISIPSTNKQTLAGAETDILFNPTVNNGLGETTLITGSGSFIGGRYNRIIPQFNKWLNNKSLNLNGYQFQFYVTASLGAVKGAGGPSGGYLGERAGIGLNYGINNTWGIGVETQWNNLPGIEHNVPSIVFGPNFHF